MREGAVAASTEVVVVATAAADTAKINFSPRL